MPKTARPCCVCEKELEEAFDEPERWDRLQPAGGGAVTLEFNFGSTQHDTDTYRGVICDECATKLKPRLGLVSSVLRALPSRDGLGGSFSDWCRVWTKDHPAYNDAIKAVPGAPFDAVCVEACVYARQRDRFVNVEYDGTIATARPGDTPETFAELWSARRANFQHGICANDG